MTPKEKAKHIFERFEYEVRDLDGDVSHTKEESIQCALICVDEMIKELEKLFKENDKGTSLLLSGGFWQEVKQEINKL